MKDSNCDVDVGIHPGPFWYDRDKDLQVCSRHKEQYDERPDLGSFNWTHGTRRTANQNKSTVIIQKAMDAIDLVLAIHENHLFPSDMASLMETKERLSAMKNNFRILPR